MKSNNLITEIIFGIIFSSIGLYILLKRKKVITALLSSNKVFWENMGFRNGFFRNEKTTKFLANIMIPFMGTMFFATGVFQICKVTIIYMK